MSKSFWTLLRGAVHAAEQDAIDRSALLILDQHIRDAAAGIERAKRALAVAIAQDEAEGRRLDSTLARIADLEERTTAALAAGREELATEAAEAIAMMEADRDAIREARALFAREIARLRRDVAGASHRLNELERGRRIAHAAEAVRRLRSGGVLPDHGATGLAEAEATLRRLRERQAEEAAADAAFQTLDAGTAGNSIADRLEAEGFGRRTRPTAASVLERLRQRKPEPAKPEPAPTKPEPSATTVHPCRQPGACVMNPQAAQHTHTSSWVTFTYATFIGSVLMVGCRHRADAGRHLGQGLFRHGHRHDHPVLHHHDQDHPRRPRKRQAREPDRGRQGRTPA